MRCVQLTGHSKIHLGHVIDGLREIPSESVHCVCTSPPYWGGIRDYQIPDSTWGDGWTGCYGNEPTVGQYVTHTLEIFAELRRVLRDDGVIWWNIGDTFNQYKGNSNTKSESLSGRREHARVSKPSGTGLEDTDMPHGTKMLVPYRVAIAMQDAGWIVRQDNIWGKKSPMPESIDGVRWERCRVKVKDADPPRQETSKHLLESGNRRKTRDCIGGEWIGNAQWAECPGCKKCENTGGLVLRRGSWRTTTAHEYVFMITKTMDYFCDASAAQERAVGGTPGNKKHKGKTAYQNGDSTQRRMNGLCQITAVETRNPRSIWMLSSEAYKGKHFAAFPTELAWRCIKSSTSKAGCCPECGSQYAPLVEKSRVATRPGNDTKIGDFMVLDDDSLYQVHAGTIVGNRDPQRHITTKQAIDYLPTCMCDAGEPVPATVLDPFTGSGTTLQVAIHTGRQFVGCEIGEQYLDLIQERANTPWATKDPQNGKNKNRHKPDSRQQSLF